MKNVLRTLALTTALVCGSQAMAATSAKSDVTLAGTVPNTCAVMTSPQLSGGGFNLSGVGGTVPGPGTITATVTAPANLIIKRDSDPLVISCASPFFGAQTLTVAPSATMALAANAFFGGLVGAGFDVMSGAGLRYPHMVIVDYPACR